VWYKFTEVSEENTASIFRFEDYAEQAKVYVASEAVISFSSPEECNSTKSDFLLATCG
jgi:hypothetical protein